MVGHFWRYSYDKFGWTTRSLPALRVPAAALGQPAVPLRHARRGRRTRHRPASCRSRGPRPSGISEDALPPVAVIGGLVAGRRHRRRPGHPDLPPAHRRPGLLGHHADGQADVRLPRPASSSWACGTPWPSQHLRRHYDYREGVSLWFREHLPFRARPGPDGRARRSASSCTRCSAFRCSRCGPSPGWCTCSARPSAT